LEVGMWALLVNDGSRDEVAVRIEGVEEGHTASVARKDGPSGELDLLGQAFEGGDEGHRAVRVDDFMTRRGLGDEELHRLPGGSRPEHKVAAALVIGRAIGKDFDVVPAVVVARTVDPTQIVGGVRVAEGVVKLL